MRTRPRKTLDAFFFPATLLPSHAHRVQSATASCCDWSQRARLQSTIHGSSVRVLQVDVRGMVGWRSARALIRRTCHLVQRGRVLLAPVNCNTAWRRGSPGQILHASLMKEARHDPGSQNPAAQEACTTRASLVSKQRAERWAAPQAFERERQKTMNGRGLNFNLECQNLCVKSVDWYNEICIFVYATRDTQGVSPSMP